MFRIELTHPLFLVGLLLLPALVYYFYRSLVDFARWQRILSLVSRALIVVLFVLALSGLTLVQPTREQFVIFAFDKSLSVGDESRKTAEDFIDKAIAAAGKNRTAFLSFANEPGLVHGDRSKESPQLDANGTNIAAAIESAAGAIPPSYVPHIVLLSDGNQTAGDALRAALRAGVPISTIPLKTRAEPEVQVSAVNVPAQVREGEPFYVEVVVDSNHDDEGTIEVYRGDHKIVSERKKLKKGENKFRFRQSTQERLANFSVKIRGLQQDTLLDNNSDSGLVFTAGKPRVLIIESDPKQAKHLAWALEQEDILVDIRPPQGMPDNLADLQNYELVVLSNVPATALSQRQMEIARTYVEDLGGGLIMVGGDQSFGLGGYYKSLLEEILPVRSDFEKEKEKPSLAMVIVIDKSGSMGGAKIELAKEAAKSAVELLGPNDKIGVIAFEGESFWIQEVTPCNDKMGVLDRISSIEAGGGTVMAPAMEDAFQALQGTIAKLKHVIILTDGISAPGDFEGIAQNMAASRITCSTVAVGNDADQKLLEEIARIGQGRYYFTDDPSSVPQIFAKETVTASKSAINEQPFVPQVLRPTQVFGGIEFDSAPFLLGYVMTRPKPTSEFVLATEKGDPLLAWWRYGLGMTVAFTSDAKSRWAAEWLTWPGFSKFWAQLVRHAMRKSEAKGVVVQVEQKSNEPGADNADQKIETKDPKSANGEPKSNHQMSVPIKANPASNAVSSATGSRLRRAAVTVDAIDPSGKYLNQAETELTVIDPHLGNRKLAMRQTAPGRYVTDFDLPHSGAYHMEIAQKHQGKVLYRQSRGLHVGYPDELRLKPTNEELLKSVAYSSGGVYDASPEAIFAPSDRAAQRALPLWPHLLMIAMFIFLADVALRRIDFALLFSRFFR